MALIIKGNIVDTSKPKLKRILAIGPGESTIKLFSKSFQLPEDVITIGLHKVLPFLHNLGRSLDYWTWTDPHGSIEGLELINQLKGKISTKAIIPYWMRVLDLYNKEIAKSNPLSRGLKSGRDRYHKLLEDSEKAGNLIILPNCINVKKLPKTHEILTNPGIRFKDNVVFGTNPYILPPKGKPYENSLTSAILPICHYLNADEVYCIGFDNGGGGINRARKIQSAEFNGAIKKKTILWVEDWQPYHKMKIYNLSPPSLSPNHTFMETVSIDNLLNK